MVPRSDAIGSNIQGDLPLPPPEFPEPGLTGGGTRERDGKANPWHPDPSTMKYISATIMTRCGPLLAISIILSTPGLAQSPRDTQRAELLKVASQKRDAIILVAAGETRAWSGCFISADGLAILSSSPFSTRNLPDCLLVHASIADSQTTALWRESELSLRTVRLQTQGLAGAFDGSASFEIEASRYPAPGPQVHCCHRPGLGERIRFDCRPPQPSMAPNDQHRCFRASRHHHPRSSCYRLRRKVKGNRVLCSLRWMATQDSCFTIGWLGARPRCRTQGDSGHSPSPARGDQSHRSSVQLGRVCQRVAP